MQSIFRYPGGKSRPAIQQQILNYAPADYAEYREPFVGGGGVFFGVSSRKSRWINDENDDLLSVYFALRDYPAQFLESCRRILPPQKGEETILSAQGKPLNRRLQEIADRLISDPDADPALKFFFLNRTAHSSSNAHGIGYRTHLAVCAAERWSLAFSPQMEQAASHLRNTTITCGDFEPVFVASGTDVWIYADPPYISDTLARDNAKLYGVSFSLADHERLADVVRRCTHKVCLSYDDHPIVHDLYRGLHIHPKAWAYCGSPRAKKKIGQELLITNYPISQTVLESRMINFGMNA